MCRAKIVQLLEDSIVVVDLDEAIAAINAVHGGDAKCDSSDNGATSGHDSTPTSVHDPIVASDVVFVQPTKNCKNVRNWVRLPLPEEHWEVAKTFPPGFHVGVYDAKLTSYFEVPSECVVPTHGAIRYVEHYNEFGPYSRFRFQLCNNFQAGRCSRGAACTYIHALGFDRAQQIHLNNGTTGRTLPHGASFYVFMPSNTSPVPQFVPSTQILVTKGSLAVYDAIMSNRRSCIGRPQHCAHFVYKKVCNRGEECNFIHSLASPWAEQ